MQKNKTKSFEFLRERNYIILKTKETKETKEAKETRETKDENIKKEDIVSLKTKRGKVKVKILINPTSYNVLMLNGGRACVPDEDWREFLRCCAFDISNNLATYYTEVETDAKKPRRLCCDLDYITLFHYVDEREIREHIKVMQREVNKFLPEGDNSAVILLAPPKKVFKNIGNISTSVFKVGVHIIWVNSIVTQEQSLRIRASWLVALETTFPPMNVDKSWGSIVDEAIYFTGLRLPGSAKCSVCRTCKNKGDNNKCGNCEGHGRIYDSSSYLPAWSITTSGEYGIPEDLRDNHYQMLTQCTVRCPNAQLRSDYQVPPNAPPYIPSRNVKAQKKHGKLSIGDSTSARKRKQSEMEKIDPTFDEDKAGISKIRQKALHEPESIEAKVLTRFIHECMPEIYAHVPIRSVWSNKQRTAFWCTTKSCYCQNVKREHNSNTIYFTVSVKDGMMHQRCWCQCDTLEGRTSGKLCKDYMSKGLKLSGDIMVTLFPNHVSKSTAPAPFGLRSAPKEDGSNQGSKRGKYTLGANSASLSTSSSFSSGPCTASALASTSGSTDKTQHGPQKRFVSASLLNAANHLMESCHKLLAGRAPCRVMTKRFSY